MCASTSPRAARGTLALAATDFVWNAASAQPAAAFAAPFVRGSSVRSGPTGGPRGHNGDMPRGFTALRRVYQLASAARTSTAQTTSKTNRSCLSATETPPQRRTVATSSLLRQMRAAGVLAVAGERRGISRLLGVDLALEQKVSTSVHARLKTSIFGV